MDTQSSKPEPPSHVFNEKLSEGIAAATVCSNTTDQTHLSLDTHAAGLRSSTANSPATATGIRSPNTQIADEINQFRNSPARTLPAWIRSVEDEDQDATATDRLLPSEPNDAFVAQHNNAPHEISRSDYFQDGDIEKGLSASRRRESRWKTFSRAIQYPQESGIEYKEVTPEWMNDNIGSYSEPWRGNDLEGDSPEYPLHNSPTRRAIWFKRFHNSLLHSPIAPLILRLTVWFFSLAALALGGSIQHFADRVHSRQGPSALMAIIVDAVALVYLVYITFDEYTAKPLGLRSPTAKARLILLDLFFIVFDSANLSLAFASLSEVTGACTEAEINHTLDPRNYEICVRQKALASVLLVALLAWLMTFAISVLRLVERVRH